MRTAATLVAVFVLVATPVSAQKCQPYCNPLDIQCEPFCFVLDLVPEWLWQELYGFCRLRC